MQNYEPQLDMDTVAIDEVWNHGEGSHAKMHDVHAYPAKFPAFIAAKAFSYAKDEGVDVSTVADVFCGCGTVALEAKLQGIDFWGCDINPVAALIARAKSQNYSILKITNYYAAIQHAIEQQAGAILDYDNAPDRIKYWFDEEMYRKLFRIKNAIDLVIPLNSKYRTAFYCIFSSCLKATSNWLTKSIKPQVDPEKEPEDAYSIFTHQYERFKKAAMTLPECDTSDIRIIKGNFLKMNKVPDVDLIVTSPPYVTSYEYADLHQLSTLWLGYVEDYRDLRKGTIGSIYNSNQINMSDDSVNTAGRAIINKLVEVARETAKTKSVARYFTDIQKVVKRSYEILNDEGMVLFIVGDTEYKGVRIENSKHILQSMADSGFSEIKLGKRKISGKILTPYRNEKGHFSSEETGTNIYHEEFVISGRKKC